MSRGRYTSSSAQPSSPPEYPLMSAGLHPRSSASLSRLRQHNPTGSQGTQHSKVNDNLMHIFC